MTEQSTSNKPKKKALLYCRGENPLFLGKGKNIREVGRDSRRGEAVFFL